MFEQNGDVFTVGIDPSAEEDGRFSKLSPLPLHASNTDNATVRVAGLLLDQKVVQYSPLVLNSQEQVYQAMLDNQSHSNGFERAAGWRSEIRKRHGTLKGDGRLASCIIILSKTQVLE